MDAEIDSQVAADIRGWDAIEDHRTGTDGDRQTSDWLADHVRAAGCSPHREDFQLSRWVLGDCRVEVGAKVAQGVPLFDGGTMDAGGIAGRLALLGDRQDRSEPSDAPLIGLGAIGHDAGADATRAFAQARADASHTALVAVAKMNTNVPGLALQNADRFSTPFGPPVLQVSSECEAWLNAAASRREQARLTIDVDFETATGTNVHTRIRGRDPDLAPLIVLTPKSSWWVSTAERGGGIAVWLALLRHFAANPPNRDVVFLATSGHELGHLGLEHHLATNPGYGARAWIHLGANFAAVGSRVRVQAADAELLDLILATLAEHGVRAPTVTPLGQRPGGEARNVHDLNERYVSFLGSNAWFHHPADRWPTTVDIEQTSRVARTVLAIAKRLM